MQVTATILYNFKELYKITEANDLKIYIQESLTENSICSMTENKTSATILPIEATARKKYKSQVAYPRAPPSTSPCLDGRFMGSKSSRMPSMMRPMATHVYVTKAETQSKNEAC